jgi:hypothetical protein
MDAAVNKMSGAQIKGTIRDTTDLFRKVAYESMHSNFTKIYFSSTTGGMLGEEASNVADDWLSGDDSENKEVSVTKEELPYVVRGAALKCSCGRQKRQINLPEGHGVYITGEPVICEKDCQALQHIMEFRVCKLHKLCKPDLAAQWKNPQNDVSVNGDKIITTKSTLICKKGGIISLENSGQKIQ